MAADPLPNPIPSPAADDGDIVYPSAIPFLLVHLGCLAAIWTGVTWPAIALCIGLYWLRMFAVTAGYHRYFSHRSFATGRVFQFVLAFLAQSTAQRSVLWWAAKHRHHHLYSDTPRDVHSPRHTGFLYSHVGWIFARRHDTTDLTRVPDLARYPELIWLHRFETLPAFILALVCFLMAGWPGLVVGFFWSTVLVYHGTFVINSLAHVRGSRRYVTGDDSRNNLALALVTMGEGWHNNHHAWPSSARQGFRWWEVDATFYLLQLLAALGVVRGLKAPPERVLRNEQELGARTLQRTAEQLAERFNPERIAHAIADALQAIDLSTLQKTLADAHDRTAETLAGLNLPHLPSRADMLVQARAMFARTPSFDDIVDRGHSLLFAAIGQHLVAVSARTQA
ncbi:MAG: delta 9 acyl-lipid fatty acid desaturase [Sphingomonas bacterium]|uniref:acyl-CoA desaturase n=1 Tax=Sphingomonas bacterium TaxID=1895847 RepID=UPI002608B79F|nr:acyl-CoA desaturase [Sphingomonas bacterium]MDB5704783.1 delta 9 acyl-lipid fatty acid desaturase [Sphingomonas bacterium]